MQTQQDKNRICQECPNPIPLIRRHGRRSVTCSDVCAAKRRKRQNQEALQRFRAGMPRKKRTRKQPPRCTASMPKEQRFMVDERPLAWLQDSPDKFARKATQFLQGGPVRQTFTVRLREIKGSEQ